MPVFVYKCNQCGTKFEIKLVFFHDPATVVCPQCGTKGPGRVIIPAKVEPQCDPQVCCPPKRRTGE